MSNLNQALIVACLIKRLNGTLETLNHPETGEKVQYHFKDDGLGNHVAVISIAEHAQRFLGIPEGYALFGAAAMPQTTIATTTFGITASGAIVAAPALAAQPITAADLGADNSSDGSDTYQQDDQPDDQPTDIDALRARFTALIGREPSPRAKAETLQAQIAAYEKQNGATA